MKKVLLNRLYTSGAYRGGTDCTQSVKYSKIHNKTRIKQYHPIHYKGSGRLMSFVTLDLLKLSNKYCIATHYLLDLLFRTLF